MGGKLRYWNTPAPAFVPCHLEILEGEAAPPPTGLTVRELDLLAPADEWDRLERWAATATRDIARYVPLGNRRRHG